MPPASFARLASRDARARGRAEAETSWPWIALLKVIYLLNAHRAAPKKLRGPSVATQVSNQRDSFKQKISTRAGRVLTVHSLAALFAPTTLIYGSFS